LATTTSNEGSLFIDPTFAEDVNVENYVTQLFPKFREKEIQSTVEQYKGLGSGKTQVTAIMSECKRLKRSKVLVLTPLVAIFVCPTYLLLNGFGNGGYKVWLFYCKHE
jgi:hypothetical protein